MADELETKKEVETSTENYLETIKKLKETSVDKDAYNELLAENKRLLEMFVDGKQPEKEPEKEKVDIDALRKELYGKDSDLSNLEYIEKTLKLRDAIIEQGGEDPFLPVGSKVIITSTDREAANRVAEGLKHCVEYAEGDSEVFTNELQRITVDSAPLLGKPKAKKR